MRWQRRRSLYPDLSLPHSLLLFLARFFLQVVKKRTKFLQPLQIVSENKNKMREKQQIKIKLNAQARGQQQEEGERDRKRDRTPSGGASRYRYRYKIQIRMQCRCCCCRCVCRIFQQKFAREFHVKFFGKVFRGRRALWVAS